MRFGAAAPKKGMSPRFNARPKQEMPVILGSDPGRIRVARWGILPAWAKKHGKHAQLINVRIESAGKFAFKRDFGERRCLIPADGFFEWEETVSGKQPHYFRLKSGEPFAFAGIWEEDEDLQEPTFAILTTEPNELVGRIHNRMPVMLKPEFEREWLASGKDVIELVGKLKPYPAKEMVEYKVSRDVNVPVNDSPELLEPVS